MKFKKWLESSDMFDDANTDLSTLAVQGDYLQDNWDHQAVINYMTTFNQHLGRIGEKIRIFADIIFRSTDSHGGYQNIYDPTDEQHKLLQMLARESLGLHQAFIEFLNKIYIITNDSRKTYGMIFDHKTIFTRMSQELQLYSEDIQELQQLCQKYTELKPLADELANIVVKMSPSIAELIKKLQPALKDQSEKLPWKIKKT